jgi:hypothetical protein
MRQIWMTALASFTLCGFAAVVSATAIAAAAEHPAGADGRAMMVDAQYQLALALKR